MSFALRLVHSIVYVQRERSGVSWQDPPHFDPGTTFPAELADYSSVYPENGTYVREPWNQTHVDMLMYS